MQAHADAGSGPGSSMPRSAIEGLSGTGDLHVRTHLPRDPVKRPAGRRHAMGDQGTLTHGPHDDDLEAALVHGERDRQAVLVALAHEIAEAVVRSLEVRP